MQQYKIKYRTDREKPPGTRGATDCMNPIGGSGHNLCLNCNAALGWYGYCPHESSG